MYAQASLRKCMVLSLGFAFNFSAQFGVSAVVFCGTSFCVEYNVDCLGSGHVEIDDARSSIRNSAAVPKDATGSGACSWYIADIYLAKR